MSLSKVACESGEKAKRGAALYLQNHHQAGFSGRHRPLNVGGLKKSGVKMTTCVLILTSIF